MVQIITTNGGGGGGGASYTAGCGIDITNNEISINTSVVAEKSDLSGYQTTSCMVCDLTGADNSHYPSAKAVSDALQCAGAGDMLKSVYDPNNCNADAFDYCNFSNTPTIPTDNCQLANGCGYAKTCDIPTNNCQLTNGCGYTTCTGTLSSCADVISALGYTPYNSTNPNGYTTCTGTVVASDLTPYAKSCDLCTVATSGKYCDLTGKPTIPTDNCQLTNGCGYTTCTGTLSTCADVISALGYTPYSSANPSGYTTCTGTLSTCTDITTALGYTPASSTDINTKTFYLSNTSDLTNAQAAYDWYNVGKNAIISYGGDNYYINWIETNYVQFGTIPNYTLGASYDNIFIYNMKLNKSGNTVTSITWTDNSREYLDGNTNYSPAYTPLYDGSPATKKYVDDHAFTATAGGVKVFAYPSVNTDISDILSWLNSGGDVILEMVSGAFKYYYRVTLHNNNTDYAYMVAERFSGNNHEAKEISYTYGVGVVSSIVDVSKNFFAPSNAGSTDQVLTKTAGGYQWATPSGGDVMVSSQANNILTSGMKIWAGTQANYEGLGTYDSNTVYLTI